MLSVHLCQLGFDLHLALRSRGDLNELVTLTLLMQFANGYPGV